MQREVNEDIFVSDCGVTDAIGSSVCSPPVQGTASRTVQYSHPNH
jgi:hypothetical protein